MSEVLRTTEEKLYLSEWDASAASLSVDVCFPTVERLDETIFTDMHRPHTKS